MKAFHEVRTYDSNFMVWYSNYENISFLTHWHREIELIYVRSGSANFNISNKSFTAYEGDLIISDTGDIHYSNSFGMDNSLDFIIFDPSIVSSRYEYSNFSHPLVKKELLDQYLLTEELHNLFHILKMELKEKPLYYEEVVKASLRKFWYHLKRRIPIDKLQSTGPNHRNSMLNNFQNLLFYMDENFHENITLEVAAKKMHFSPSYFSKVFKNFTGITFVKYLNLIRVEHAMEQLKTSGNKIIDIALSCGFNNIRTFNRVFKGITGYTPSEFEALPDKEYYNLGYYQIKSSEQQHVENDSITIVKNSS